MNKEERNRKYDEKGRQLREKVMSDGARRPLRSDSGMNTYAIILAAISLVMAVLFFVNASVGVGFIFVGLALLLVLMVFLPKIIIAIKNKK